MPKFKNHVHYNGVRFEPGDDVPEEIVPFIDEANFAEEYDPEAVAYQNMSKKQLEDMLAERGLPTSGTKTELVERLEADDSGID